MNRILKNQKGFAVLEGLLIIVIIAIIGGIGWYALHTKHQTDKILTQADKISQSTPTSKSLTPPSNTPTRPTKYLNIVQWGIRIPYTGDDTYSYSYHADAPGIVDVISKSLSDKYGCKEMGAGELIKDAPTDPYGPSEDAPTAQQTEKQYPGTFKVVGGYYYTHVHDQAACSDTVTLTAQNAANDAVHALVPKIEAIPQ